MSKSRRKRIKIILLLPVFVVGVMTVCFLSGIIYSIPERAEELFGAPAPDLSLVKHYYLSIRLTAASDQLSASSDSASQPTSFTIQSGESTSEIIRQLDQQSLIQHPELFRLYLVYSGLDRQIQPGEYWLDHSLSDLETAAVLSKPGTEETTVSVLAGWRAEEIAATLPDLGLLISPDDFLAAVQRRDLEGYLFPGTYPVSRKITADELVDLMYQSFLEQIDPSLEAGWSAQGLSTQEAVILASIIEREAVLEEEKPLIASVFLNRLQEGMPLGADPTVQYALGFDSMQNTWWKTPLTKADLSSPSPYNTYQNTGLPPGPICNPGLKALQAAAQPEAASYLYFRASCDGSGKHSFSETYQQHLDNACP